MKEFSKPIIIEKVKEISKSMYALLPIIVSLF